MSGVRDFGDGVFDDFGDPDRSRRARVLAFLSHLLPTALVAYLATSALFWFSVLTDPYISIVANLAVLLIGMMPFLFHVGMARLCLRCMQGVPADAPVRAARWTWLLWIYHKAWARFWVYVLVLVSLMAFREVTRAVFDLTYEQSPWLAIPGDLFVTVVIWSVWKHHRYRPWCPYCKDWGDGGEHERVPDPDTVGTKTKT